MVTGDLIRCTPFLALWNDRYEPSINPRSSLAEFGIGIDLFEDFLLLDIQPLNTLVLIYSNKGSTGSPSHLSSRQDGQASRDDNTS